MRALFAWISARHFAQEWLRTALTVAGVVLGVAVFVSIRLANTSALASFRDTVDAVAGKANLEVQGDGEGFDERVYPVVRRIPGVIAAAPAIQVYTLARPGGASAPAVLGAGERGEYHETLLVLGLDLLAEGPFARSTSDPAAPDSLDRRRDETVAFLRDPRAVGITGPLARRLGLARGDSLTILASGVPVTLIVRRVLESRGLDQAFDGRVAIVDIATAQVLFHRIGRLDRIDLIADPARRDEVQRAVAVVLPPGARAGTSQSRTVQVENMVRAFGLNLTALSFIALFVSTFLIFDAISTAVVRRRREIGILRALGVTRGQVRALFLVEGLVFGGVGGLIGLAAGTLLARGALHAVSRTLTDLYLVVQAGAFHPDLPTYAAGLGLGMAAGLVSALAPAVIAARTPPELTMRQGPTVETRPRAISRWTWAGLALLAAGALIAIWTVREHQPFGGFASAFVLLAGFSLVAPGFTLLMARIMAPPLRRIAGIEGALGARFLRESVARTSVAVAAVMVAVGMLVALSIMVGSFRETVDLWIRQTIRGDLYVEPAGHRLNASSTVLPPALIEAAGRIKGVAAIDTYRGTRVVLDGRTVLVAGLDFAIKRSRGSFQLLRGSAGQALGEALARDAVLVSESFAHHFRVREGDSVTLETVSGRVRLPIVAVYYDYSTDAGAILMDRRLYARLWNDPRAESMALYLEPGASYDAVRERLIALAGGSIVLNVMPNRALRERVLVVFDQTFQITGALQAIAVLVAVLGVIGTLTALILQRGRDIGVLRAVGALRRQVQIMVLAESGLLGLIGGLLGCVCGIALSILLVHVINKQFFGWTIHMHLDPWVFVRAVAMTVAASLLAGLIPARLAASRLPSEAMRME